MTSMRVGGREMIGASLSIQGDVSDVLVTLVDRTTTIAGTVAGVQARADRTRVIVFPQNRAERSQYLIVSELRRVKQAFVGADGRFTTTVLPGDYYVAAVDGEIPDTWMTPESLERLVSDATAVSVALGDSRQIQVSPPRGGVR
jgi:1-aminocyclopropane-1-carboxylate deaminase/D-cysteine desulfhydrase-like pyridoxal-dependent ACC family enzyme